MRKRFAIFAILLASSIATNAQDRYFGLHFDFHAGLDCKEIGSTLSEEDIRDICTMYKPDFIQVDSKGHPGWSSYPTEFGDEVPGIVGNPMETWRKVTKEQGVQLYAHHSGIFDHVYCTNHPDEAVKDAGGNPSKDYARANGRYADDKLIPQLLELAGRYGLDGVWVDGDCWGAQMDFDPRTVKEFEKATGINLGGVMPVSSDNPYYMEYADFCRSLYRDYLKHYTDSVHARYPDFKVISNWAFTEHMAGPVTADTDCISGDLDWKKSIMWGRYSGRSAVMQGRPWDMMAWSFRNIPGGNVTKTPVQLMQEGACIISLGGGFQFYVPQDRKGAPKMDVLRYLAPTAEFFHSRREWTFGGQPRKQVAVLMETAQRLAEQGEWAKEGNTGVYTRAGYQRIIGLISLLCDAGHSVTMISERELASGEASGYPVIIVPDLFQKLEDSTWDALSSYADNGGVVVLTGRQTAKFYGYEAVAEPTAFSKGEGKIAVYPGERSYSYMTGRRTDIMKSLSDFLLTLYEPEVRLVSATGIVEIVDFEKDGRQIVQLVNCNGNHYDESSLTEESIPPVLDVVLKIRMDKRPKAIYQQPDGKRLKFKWNDGYAEVMIPRVDIHSSIVVVQSDTLNNRKPNFDMDKQIEPKKLLLTDYEPVSVFKLSEHHPHQAKFRAIDMHAHPEFAETVDEIKAWSDRLEANNIDRVVIYTYAFGDQFEEIYDKFKSVSDKFEMWCGLNLDRFGHPDFVETAIADLERCVRKGAKGVGELGDKGFGEAYSLMRKYGKPVPTAHIDDPVFDPIFDRIGELGLAVCVHIGDPIWMYEPMDNHNDGLMNSYAWRIEPEEGLMGLYELTGTLERAMAKHPDVRFIACHFMNISHDYEYLSGLMDKYPNLYLDNSARIVETCVTPRATKAFYEKYQDRIFFGTDNGPSQEMFDLQWRCLETEDEHFYHYDPNFFTEENSRYHWPLQGIGLSDEVLRKIYHDNAVKFMGY